MPSADRLVARGLSLVEVLVALAISALLLSWLLPGAAQALQRRQHAAQLMQAVHLARNQVERLSVWPAVLPVPAAGREGALAWRVEQVGAERSTRSSGVALLTFRIVVRAGQDPAPLVDLTVKRLGRAPS